VIIDVALTVGIKIPTAATLFQHLKKTHSLQKKYGKCRVRLSAILLISGDKAPENRSNYDAHTDSQQNDRM
jgi:hypothetical protein